MARISLRTARPSDDRLTWGWVRHPSVWKQSLYGTPIPWKTHREWFSRVLTRAGSEYIIAESPKGRPIGQVRFERAGMRAEVSIVIARESRGQGLGTRVLKAACARHFRGKSSPPILAHIRPGNAGSVRAFLAAGFRVTGMVSQKGIPCFRLARARAGRP